MKQLSELYGVSTKTFRRWILPISQVKRIVQHLGVPGSIIVD